MMLRTQELYFYQRENIDRIFVMGKETADSDIWKSMDENESRIGLCV